MNNARILRFTPPAYVGLALFVAIIALVTSNPPVFEDADTAWHLASGELIRAQHALSFQDPWSFTATEDVWYNISWLFDLSLSFLFDYTGFSGLYAVTILVFAVALAAMAYYCVERGASPLMVFLTTIIVLPVVKAGVIARPNLCSILLTLVFYFVLHRYRNSSRLRDLLILPPLMVLWVNLHGGFLLAFLIIGLFIADAASRRNREQMKLYGFILAACLAASLINPYGFTLYYGAYRTLSDSFDQTQILEWQPVKIGQYLPVTVLLLLILCIGDSSDKRIPLVDRLLAIILVMLSLTSLRHSIISGILLMPYMTLRLSSIVYESSWVTRIRKFDTNMLLDMQRSDVRLKAAIMAVCAIIFVCAPYPRDAILHKTPGFPHQQFPVYEAAFIAQHYPNLHFLNDYNIGGYLDYLWRGRVKVFVDGRSSSVYSEDLLNDYSDYMSNIGLGMRAEMVENRYHIDGLIIANTSLNAADWRWNPRWKVVYHGKVATVYLRNKNL